MASLHHFTSPTFTKLVILFTILSSLLLFHASDIEFQVGGDSGWVVPPANNSDIYNQWASGERFSVGDTVRFKYKKDSVMEVTEDGYTHCNSTHPSFYSNTGDTTLKLDHPGFFYFISGANGHCRRGQRMVIRVLSDEHEDDKATPSSSSSFTVGVSEFVALQSVVLFLASAFF
ncbi:early nodulin-like protein 1 [Heracleum sosnowskyi]|uniref:Early nodulin-like protein 1 n=1 Tax=Heracleum sosnowskyi TaxID=360622 RepID=A0AAD8H2T5_9APIA|nr:early nodulin-like protein 1 [Heracleum sosnowskyi]